MTDVLVEPRRDGQDMPGEDVAPTADRAFGALLVNILVSAVRAS